MIATPHPGLDTVWGWLAEVPDPEIPVVSVVDLGMVRAVAWDDARDELVVTVTPTYSGCPATRVIAFSIEAALRGHGIERLRLENQLAPAWTTDWISETGRAKLEAYGIATTRERAGDAPSPLARLTGRAPVVTCPHCASTDTEKVSAFGSTPCKAQYRCRACAEPFDYFKCV